MFFLQVETENFISDPSHAVTQMKLHLGKKAPLYRLSCNKSSQPSKHLSENKSSKNMIFSSKEWNSCQYVYQSYPKAKKRYLESNILIRRLCNLKHIYVSTCDHLKVKPKKLGPVNKVRKAK